MLRCCFNKRVIAGLALAAVGLLAVAPSLALTALPLLLAAACPLSMLLMGRAAMTRSRGEEGATQPGRATTGPGYPANDLQQPSPAPGSNATVRPPDSLEPAAPFA